MRRMRAGVLAALLALLLLTGCFGRGGGCTARAGQVTICVSGKPVDFSGQPAPPHAHELGNLYAPVLPLARAVGLPVTADPRTLVVIIAGRPFAAPVSPAVKGIHLHAGVVYVPLREFAAAAGLRLDLDFARGTANLSRA